MNRRKLQAETFDGFIVIIPCNNSMDCTRWIPNLQVTKGNHTITENFYVVNVDDTNVVLGVQYVYSIGEHTMNYQVAEMRFKNSDGKPILLRGMHTYPNQVVSYPSMRSILMHGDIEWVIECLITSSRNHLNVSRHPKEIK